MSGPSASCSSGAVSVVYIKRRHGTILLRAGFQYHTKRKHKSGLTIWECTKRKKQCKGIIKIKDNNVLHETKHSCTPDFLKNEVDERLYSCKLQITKENYPAVPQAYNDMVGSFQTSGFDLICKVPNFQSVKSSLYRFRNAAAGVTHLKSKQGIKVEIPPEFDDFVLADYCDGDNRIIIFCTEKAKKVMSEVNDYYSDGTFKSCPPPFTQLYTIHGDLGSTLNNTNIVPLVYALMSDKKIKSYVILFSMIKSQVPGWNPNKYKTDYEKAAMSALTTVFPSVNISGCYYHFNKSIWEKGRKLGITKSNDRNKIREVALSAVLPLLPPNEILNGWKYITRKSTQEDDIKKFRAYMETQWMIDEFVKVWCVYGEQHRTTNFLESWHHKLNQAIGKKNPNIIHFLKTLVKDSAYYSVCNSMITNKIKTRKKKYVLNDEFIQDTQMEFLHGNMTVGVVIQKLLAVSVVFFTMPFVVLFIIVILSFTNCHIVLLF